MSPTEIAPSWKILLPVLASTAELPPVTLRVLISTEVVALWVIAPVMAPMVGVLSPSTRPPLGALMLGRARALVPRMVTALALALAVCTVPLSTMSPAAVPSWPVRVMVPPLVPVDGPVPTLPPVALMLPEAWTMPRPVREMFPPPLAYSPAEMP